MKIHKQCFDKLKELVLRLQLYQTIDKLYQTILHLQNLMDNEKNKCREILRSVVKVIKFLCKQNLTLHGHREDSNSRKNFLKTLKLLAKYHAVIKEHLLVIQISSKDMTTYLSLTIQNELIELLGKNVKHLILEEIKAAKYKRVVPKFLFIAQKKRR